MIGLFFGLQEDGPITGGTYKRQVMYGICDKVPDVYNSQATKPCSIAIYPLDKRYVTIL